MLRFWIGLALLLIFSPVPIQAQEGMQRELLVVSGGCALRFFEKGKTSSHDKYWGNFIDTGAMRIKELLAARQPTEKVTWLVYRPSYQIRGFEMNVDLPSLILKRANTLGVALMWFDTKEQLVNYLNVGQDRKTMPIATLDYFGHSNKVCLMFDYSGEYESQSREFLHERELKLINQNIFTPDVVAKSWGCHSGESFSQRWFKRFGLPLEGAIGKTDYSRVGQMPFLSSPEGRWVNQ